MLTRAGSAALVSALCLSQLACNFARTPALARIPLLNCSGFPCVDAEFGGTKLRLLISLADQYSSLTSQGTLKADTKRPPKEVGKARSLRLGPVELNDLFTSDDTLGGAFPEGASKTIPSVDGTLSYGAWGERLVVLHLADKYLEVSEKPLTRPVCTGNCSELRDSRAEGRSGTLTLATDGFAIANTPVRARIDTLYSGSAVILEKIPGLNTDGNGPVEGSYRGNHLASLRKAPIYFGGKAILQAAPILRADPAFGTGGRQFDSAIGLTVLSTGAYAFDLRSMKMWRYQ